MKAGREVAYFEEIEVGEAWFSNSRTLTETDIVNFAGLSGDFNPLHVDEEFSKKSIFGKRIAHGLLGLSIASGLQTSHKPWAITAFMGLDWKFSKPIFIGDTVYYQSSIKNKKDMGGDSGIVRMERKLINQNEEVVQQGTWTLMIKKQSS